MSYLAIHEVANSQSFRARCAVAVLKGASYVLGEDRTVIGQVKAEKRYQLALESVANPEARLSIWVWAMLANDTIQAKGMDATDDELLFQAVQAWNVVAGVTLAEDQAAPEPTA